MCHYNNTQKHILALEFHPGSKYTGNRQTNTHTQQTTYTSFTYACALRHNVESDATKPAVYVFQRVDVSIWYRQLERLSSNRISLCESWYIYSRSLILEHYYTVSARCSWYAYPSPLVLCNHEAFFVVALPFEHTVHLSRHWVEFP